MKFNTNQAIWKRLGLGAAALIVGTVGLQAQFSVTVQVDMNDLVGTFTTVHAPGSWNGFNPEEALMTDGDGDNIYEITFDSLPSGVQQTYKFVTDSSYAGEESVPSACGVPNGFGAFDRAVSPTADETIAPVCFSSCVSCSATVNVDVTFLVNMGNVITSDLGAHLAGTLNGFTPTAMDDTDGDDIWSITYNLTAGNVVQYKYLNGNDFAFGEVGDSACGIDNGFGAFDRILTVPTSDTTVSPTCFNECSDCVISCDVSNPPANPSNSIGINKVFLAWNGIANTVACQIKAERLTPAGPSPSANILVPEAQGYEVPFNVLGGGTTWDWQVRCACTTSPILASGFSVKDTFSVPTPRVANNDLQTELFPNPAVDQINVRVEAAAAGTANWTVVDMLGRQVNAGQQGVEAGMNTVRVALNNLNNGIYFLQLEQGDMRSVNEFSVIR